MATECAHLPPEMVDLIASRLGVKEIQRCSLVCRAWRAALAESPYRRSPCLMRYEGSKGMWQFHEHTRSWEMQLPRDLDKARIHSSNHGWLLMKSRDESLFFFDPFNKRSFKIKQMRSSKAPPHDAFHFFNPPTSPECFVVSIRVDCCSMEGIVKIGILKRFWSAWQTLNCPIKEDVEVELSKPVLRGGLLHFVDAQGNVATLDVHNIHTRTSWTVYAKCLPFRQLRNKITNSFLFRFKGDEALYAVFLFRDDNTVNVFRLSEPEMKWESVQDLGGKMVYLSNTSCFGDTAHSQSMANKIFFPALHDHDHLLCYSLATRKCHSLDDCDFSGAHSLDQGVAWILPAPNADDAGGDAEWQIQRNKLNHV